MNAKRRRQSFRASRRMSLRALTQNLSGASAAPSIQHQLRAKHHVRGLRRHWSGSGDRADGGRSDGGRSGGSAGASATDGGVSRWHGGVLQAVPRGVRRAKPRRSVGAQGRVRHAPHLRDHRALGEMRGAWGDGERARKKGGSYERASVMTIYVRSPASPYACALGTMERGQLPREIDLEMLRGPNYGLGGKKVWLQPFADWASRWSKRGAGDAPAIVETNGGSATATAAAHAAVAELLRAVAAHLSHLRVSGRAHTCVRASPPRLTRVRVVSRHRTAPSCARRLASSPRVIVSRHHLWRHRRGARSAGSGGS